MDNFETATSSSFVSFVGLVPPPLPQLLEDPRGVADQVEQPLELVGVAEGDVFAEEKSWFVTRVEEVLTKLRKVLHVTGDSGLDEPDVFHQVVHASSLEQMFLLLQQATSERASQLFHDLLTNDEWKELVESDDALTSQDVIKLRKARLKRQWRLLSGMQQTAVDLTVQDTVGIEEETRLVSECMQMMQNVLTKVGMNPRGTMRRPKAKKIVEAVAQPAEQEIEHEDVQEHQRPQRRREREKSPPKEASPRVVKKRKAKPKEVSESEEGEAGVQEAEVVENSALTKLLVQAYESVEAVSKMLREYYANNQHLTIDVKGIEPPCSSLAEPSVLASNEKLAIRCLDEEDGESHQLEEWAHLFKFWRLCRRALVIVAVFKRLNQSKSRGGTLIQNRFDDAIRRLKCSKPIQYRQALVYQKIGQFLLRFPRFMFQLRLVQLDEWSSVIEQLEEAAARGVLVDWADNPEYVSRESSSEHAEANHRSCYVCSQGEERGNVWSCYECRKGFHELCGQYPENSLHGEIHLPGGVKLEPRVYCVRCLERVELQQADVVRRVAEIVAIGRFFNAPECRFRLEPVPGDGYCLFGILERFARQYLGFTGSSDQFCKTLAKVALESFEKARAEIGGLVDEEEEASMDAFKSLANGNVRGAKGRVKGGLWERMEAQHILRGYTDFLYRGQVIVHSYQATNDGRVGESGTYGTHGRELFVLHWSNRHYDGILI